jgi:hypothetical protein
VIAAIGSVLVLAPLVAAYMDGVLDDLLSQGHWRPMLSPAAVITYILAVVPQLNQVEEAVIDALRPMVQIDGESFDRLLLRAARISPVSEVIAFGVGAALGLFVGQSWQLGPDAFWLRLVLIPSVSLMFGVLVWTIFVAVSSTRLINELHEQPLHIDIFDTTAFRPIGRQSLIIALVFVGGIVLGALFSLNEEAVLDWRNWVLYLLLAFVAILVFFLNMRPTHRVLSAVKNRELKAVQQTIVESCRTLLAHIDTEEWQESRERQERQESTGMRTGSATGTLAGESTVTLAGESTGTLAGESTGTLAGESTGTLAGKSTGTLAAEINALAAYEDRLKATSTWPYNTAMLRTLFISVIIPGAAALARVLGDVFSQ